MAGMWNALSISASGLAASAAQLTSAASKIASAFTGAPVTPPPAQPVPSSPSAPAARPLSGSTAVAAQQTTPASWMVEILAAKYAYRANAAALTSENQVAQKTIDLVG